MNAYETNLQRLTAIANKKNLVLNPDKARIEKVVGSMTKNFEAVGEYVCPCKQTNHPPVKGKDVLCPCPDMMDEIEEFLLALSARTSLEEALDWDFELVEYLVGAWGNATAYMSGVNDEETHIALMVAQLPADKYEKYQEKLEKWVSDNYNMFVR